MTHKTFLITRPCDQNQSLIAAIIQANDHFIELPCIDIKALTIQAPADFDISIFTSTNAVKCAPLDKMPSAPVIAIGPATQKALQQHGINSLIPDIFNSEGILALPLLQNIDQKRISIFTGLNPRPLLYDSLLTRGAKVNNVFCYERNCPTYSTQVLQDIMTQPINMIITSSPDALINLQTIFNEHKSWLLDNMLLVVSDKMNQMACQAGFQTVLQAENATDAAVIAMAIGLQ